MYRHESPQLRVKGTVSPLSKVGAMPSGENDRANVSPLNYTSKAGNIGKTRTLLCYVKMYTHIRTTHIHRNIYTHARAALSTTSHGTVLF